MAKVLTCNLWRYYPILLTAIGIVIHAFGSLKLIQPDVPQLNHAIMLVVDSLVVYGLIKRTTWGYWLAVLLYIQQSIMQPYWAYQNYLKLGGLFQILVTCPLVIGSLILLALNKKLFIKNS